MPCNRAPAVVSAPRTHLLGFTLVELLAVIAIIAILAGILLAVIGSLRTTARSATTLSNLRQLAIGARSHANDNKGVYADHSGNQWIPTLWRYIHPEIKYPGLNGAGEPNSLKGSAFDSPLMTEDTLPDGTVARAFGMNAQIPVAYPDRRYNNCPYPAQTFLFGDSGRSSTIPSKQWMTPRYHNSIHLGFLDCSARLMPYADIPSTYNNALWKGI